MAISLDTENSLGYTALALAQSLDSDHERALANARRALESQPRIPIVNAMVSLVLLNAGKPEETKALLLEALRKDPDGYRTPYLNVLAIAQYVTGDLRGAATSLEENLARGGPTGPHMDVFLAATYANLGRSFEAQAVIDKLQRMYPDYPTEDWLAYYIKSDDEIDATMNKLRSLGLAKDN